MKNQDEAIIAEVAGPKISELGGFLVDVKVSPHKVLVEMDKPLGVTISECIQVSKFLSNEPRLNEIFEKHELEVSSPGMDNPFRVRGQYEKSIGKNVKVKSSEGTVITGNLQKVTDEGIELQEKPEKKKETGKIVFIPFSNITETKILFSF